MQRNLIQNHEEALKGTREFIANSIPQGCSLAIIAAGPLFKQPGTVAFRTVLHRYTRGKNTGEFVVYREYFPRVRLEVLVPMQPISHLEAGSYFLFSRDGRGTNEAEAFAEALQEFARRVGTDAEFAKSLNRPEVLMSDELLEAQAAHDLQL